MLIPNFSMMAFAAAIEPLRSANRMSGRNLYNWRLYSRDGGAVRASNGLEIAPHAAIADNERPPMLVVCAGLGDEQFEDRAVFAWLRRLASEGSDIGSLSTGAYVLARAGLLDDRNCALHWEYVPGFIEAFPRVKVQPDLFVIDGNRFTCSGGTAALDMMLHLVSLQHGHALAAAVSEQFIHDRIRDRHDRQRMQLRARLGISHPAVLAAVDAMEANLEEPLDRAAIAARVGVSPRQLERLFRRYLGNTPTRHYLELRLQHARSLLAQTSMSILEVALACGFTSASHFSKCYRELFGMKPRESRAPPVASATSRSRK